MGATTDIEALLLRIEASATKLEKDMAKANLIFDRGARKMEAQAKTLGAKIGSTFSNQISLGFSRLSAIGIVGGIAAFRSVTQSMDDLMTSAERLHMPVEDLQEWRYAAGEADVEVEALEAAFLSLSRKIGEAANDGKSSAANTFAALGISVRDAGGNVKSTTEVVTELASAIKRLPSDEQRIAVMFELAKNNGAELLRILEMGPDTIQATLAKARELGLVLDSDVVERGAELNRQFEVLEQRIGVGIKGAILDVTNGMQRFLDLFTEANERSSDTLGWQLNNVYAGREKLKEKIAADQEKFNADPGNVVLLDQLEGEKAKLEELTTEAMKLRDILDRRAGWQSGENVAFTPETPQSVAPLSPAVTPPSKPKTAKTQYDPLASISQRISDLKAEAATYGMTREQALAYLTAQSAIAEAEQRLGPIGDKLKGEIEQKADAYAALAEASERAKEKQQEAAETERYFTETMAGSLSDLIVDGQSFGDVMSGVAKSIEKAALQAALLGEGPLASLFGLSSSKGILGSLWSSIVGNASGGVYRSPSLHAYSNRVVSRPTMFAFAAGAGLMGEAGAEAIMPLRRDASGKLGVRAVGAGQSKAEARPISLAMTVNTPDATSFRRSQAQVSADLVRMMQRAKRVM